MTRRKRCPQENVRWVKKGSLVHFASREGSRKPEETVGIGWVGSSFNSHSVYILCLFIQVSGTPWCFSDTGRGVVSLLCNICWSRKGCRTISVQSIFIWTSTEDTFI